MLLAKYDTKQRQRRFKIGKWQQEAKNEDLQECERKHLFLEASRRVFMGQVHFTRPLCVCGEMYWNFVAPCGDKRGRKGEGLICLHLDGQRDFDLTDKSFDLTDSIVEQMHHSNVRIIRMDFLLDAFQLSHQLAAPLIFASCRYQSVQLQL